jgi:hypothetical protein
MKESYILFKPASKAGERQHRYTTHKKALGLQSSKKRKTGTRVCSQTIIYALPLAAIFVTGRPIATLYSA